MADGSRVLHPYREAFGRARRVPRGGLSFFPALAIKPGRAAHVRFGTKRPWIRKQSMSALTRFSDIDLFGYCKRIVHLDP
jgi:hypothetical protein